MLQRQCDHGIFLQNRSCINRLFNIIAIPATRKRPQLPGCYKALQQWRTRVRTSCHRLQI